MNIPIDSPQTQSAPAEVRTLCKAVMLCDGHLADGELALLDELAKAWPQQPNPGPAKPPRERLAV